MSFMRITFFISLLSLMTLPVYVQAQLRGTAADNDFTQKATSGSFLMDRAFTGTRFLFFFFLTAFIVSVLYVVLAHTIWIDKPEHLMRAKKCAMYSFIGATVLFILTIFFYMFARFL